MAMTVHNKYNVVHIKMIIGDVLAFNIRFDEDVTLTSAKFTCREGDSDDIVFQKTLNDGITQVDTKQYHVEVASADTASESEGRYDYDLQITVDGQRSTLMIGKLTLIQGVSR
mgnify:CR=1 FL=1